LSEQKESYRQIFRATSIFGGVQFINIILTVIRSKLIALLLGPAGMGIAGLLTSTVLLIGSLTNLGLGKSAVKNVAEAAATGDQVRIAHLVSSFRRLVWITGVFGCFATLLLAPWLSSVTFGSSKYTIAFACLSITLIFNQLSSGQVVLLQGMRKLSLLAVANISGSVIGLLTSIPLYFFYGLNGVVPSLISTAFVTMILSWYYARKLQIPTVSTTFRMAYLEGREMMKMGVMLSLNSIITLGTSYVVRIFISRSGGIADVGLYNAGFAIISTYVGLIFTAMGTDYYPRLSSIVNDKEKARELINNQAELAILVLAPILCVFMVFIKFLIEILYSKQFMPVNGMLHWAALGMFFKATSWPLGFLFLAKGDGKAFFWNELVANVYLLVLNILGYKYFGLTGMGMSFFVGYVIYLGQVFCVTKKKYLFEFRRQFIVVLSIQFFLGLLCFFSITFTAPLAYVLGSLKIFMSISLSIYELNKRMDLMSVLHRLKRKNGKIN
jgi:O-antigen/teichoic acid export membrane protein